MQHPPKIKPNWTSFESVDYSCAWGDIVEDTYGNQVAEMFLRSTGWETLDYPMEHVRFETFEVAGVSVTEGREVQYFGRERLMAKDLIGYGAICRIEERFARDKAEEAV